MVTGQGMHVGIAGAGRIGAHHAALLASSPRVGTLTIADEDGSRAAAVAGTLGARTAPTAADLVASGVDALVIAAATPAHAALIHLAADAGVPAFCEKPISLDLDATDAVLEHVHRAGILLQVGFQRRFDPGYCAAREAVRSGRLGDLYLARSAGHDPAPPPEAYIAASGGIWRDLVVHDFDILPWVTGREIVEVYADGTVGGELYGRHEDVHTAAAMLRFAGGPMGIMSATRDDPLGYDVRLELFGSRDSIAVGMDERTPLRSVEPGVPQPAGKPYRNFLDRFDAAYRAELNAFLEAVRDGDQSPCPGAEARQALRVALAAERSRCEHRPVAVAEIT